MNQKTALISVYYKEGIWQFAADGKNLTDVQKYFADNGLAVAYVPPRHRGFARH